MTATVIPGGPRVPAELVTDAGVNVEENAALVIPAARTIDFEGAGVTVQNVQNVAVVTISGGGSGIAIDEGGSPVVPVATTVDFEGAGVVVTHPSTNRATVTIAGAGGGGVHTNGTLTGDGSSGTPLGVVAASLDNTVTVAVDGTTVAGNGTNTPLHTVDGGTGVVTDATLTGNGKTGNPLHVVGGGGSSNLTIYRPPTPANGGTVALHADALNVVDIQNVSSLGLLLNLPAANSVPSGTPLNLTLVNMEFISDAQRGPFTIPPGVPGINAMLFTVTGADTINGVGITGIFAIFTKSGDFANLRSDGVSDWIVEAASWINVQRGSAALIVSGNGNQIVTETDGPVPSQLYCSAAADGTEIIALSAGYFGQIVTIINSGDTHSFLLLPNDTGVPLTDNCCYITGNAQSYRVDPGEAIYLQFGQRTAGGTPNLWYVIGHNTQLS